MKSNHPVCTRLRSQLRGLVPVALAAILSVSGLAAAEATTTLTLADAEHRISKNPSLAAYRQKILALRHQAIAAAQLPDPHLSLGAVDLPTNNFSMNQQQMSMLSVGLSQTFPPFGQLTLRGRQLRMEARAASASKAERAAELRWLLQQSWIQALVGHDEMRILVRQEQLARLTEQAATAAYRAGRADEADVLRSRLARVALENEKDQIRSEQTVALARITELLRLSAPPQLVWRWPHAAPPPALSLLIARIPGQPTLQAAAANERAARVSVQVAHRSLLPSITVSTSYGQDFMPGSPNWLSVGVNLSLPIFPGDRQDQTIAAAQEQEMAAVDDYDEQRLRIARELRSAYAQYQAADAEYKRGQQDLTLLATQTYSAELNDFRGGRGRFQSVLRAQNTVLTTALETLTARRDRALAIAQLDFLTTQYRRVQP